MAKLDAPDGPYAALVLAKAGMVRVGMGTRITSDVPPPTLFYAVSQGALGIEIRSDDAEARALCEALTHRETAWRCSAERACLRVLEGGCSVPVGVASALALGAGGEVLTLTGCVTAIDGQEHVQHTLSAPVGSLEDAERVGARLAKILMDSGAKTILDEINVDRTGRVDEAREIDAADVVNADVEK